ncbi:hypothetical protein H3V53_42030 [Paraburkholderia bengalensis]|uniref:AlgX/AlgJ SGNH hydrolase-like domain-containing protein n=1 Tax=Paraburkholderia bengalensis TaxID=2747562 RepID=A0ABU8J6Y1_9BURK
MSRASVDGARRRLLLALVAAPLASLALAPRGARAAAATSVIEGRNLWLYPGWESLSDDATPACLKALDLIRRTTEQFDARGIRSVIAIAPLKARSCAENLPEGTALSAAVTARFAAMQSHARQLGLALVDSPAAIAAVGASQEKYIRADYHWSGHSSEAVAQRAAELVAAAGPLKGEAGAARAWANGTKRSATATLRRCCRPSVRRKWARIISSCARRRPRKGSSTAGRPSCRWSATAWCSRISAFRRSCRTCSTGPSA